jgi:hypothetical protein
MDFDIFDWIGPGILCVLAVLVLLPYVVGPLLIKLTLKQSDEPELTQLPLDDPKFPKSVTAHFRKVTEALRPAGFEPAAALGMPNQVPKVSARLLLLANRRTKDAAAVTLIYADEEGFTLVKTSYVEFISRFRDGTLVQTNNSEELNAFARRPGQFTTQLPLVREPERLYRLHQALAERHGGGSGKVLRLDEEFRGDATAYLSRAIVEELEGQIDTGYMYYVESEGQFRPTLKGAFLMTWGLLWPFTALRRMRRDREARRIIGELERG